MIVISHRGYWKERVERNTELAFRRSFDLGFGTETDVRDCLGKLVICHDMPLGNEMPFPSFLSLAQETQPLLAINIKADGLAGSLSEAMAGYPQDRWFVFDMSVPDMRSHIEAGNPVFARMSEVEREPAWLDRAEGIWLDGFSGDWATGAMVQGLLGIGKRVCVVSPELHGRDHRKLWAELRQLAPCSNLILCTDIPESAQAFFEGTQHD